MPTDDGAPLLHRPSRTSRFLRFVRGMTRAGKAGSKIYSKAKKYSIATQNKGERAFATFAKAAKYIDTAAWVFPPAKAFTKPIAFASGKINSVLELRSLFNMNAGKWDELLPLTIESDLLNLRECLEFEINATADSDTWTDPEENPLIRGIDGMIAMIQQRDETPAAGAAAPG